MQSLSKSQNSLLIKTLKGTIYYMNRKQIINDLIEFIDNSPVNYFAVKNSIEIL